MSWILLPEHVPERNSPILIHIPFLVVYFRRTFGGWHHDNLRRAVEKRHVGTLQFIAKVNRKRDGSRIRHLLATRDGITTTRRAPPRSAVFGVWSTVKTYPRLACYSEIHKQTAATRDG